jgi:hypothetical protein
MKLTFRVFFFLQNLLVRGWILNCWGDLIFQYAPEQMIDIKSNWKINRNNHYTNLTGAVMATTPFSVCNKGYLISKIYYTKTKYIRGIANLDLDHKKFTASFEGKCLIFVFVVLIKCSKSQAICAN